MTTTATPTLAGDPADIPATLTAAAAVLRHALDQLGTRATAWTYIRRDNWPHAGELYATSRPRAVVADVYTGGGAGEYLAVMAPPLASALIDWLTAVAVRERERQQSPGWYLPDVDEPQPGDEVFAALVVAHTVLTAARDWEG